MKKLKYTKREAIRLHRKMWQKLAENGARYKPKVDALCSCYACQYDFDKHKHEYACTYCPFEWPQAEKTKTYQCLRSDGLFDQWYTTESPERRKALALQIANLPERKLPRRTKR